MAGTVTATQGGSTASGIRAFVRVVTGAAASPIGQANGVTSTTPSISVTSTTAGSLVYGSNLGLAGTYTPNAATIYQANNTVGATGLQYISLRSTSTVAGGTVTLGGTAGVNSISIVVQEILSGAGIAEDASSPAAFGGTGLTATSASFNPPTSLLVVSVQSNGGGGATTMAITDTLGGLTWTERIKQNGAGNGYAGIWTAPFTAGTPVGPGFLIGMEI